VPALSACHYLRVRGASPSSLVRTAQIFVFGLSPSLARTA